MGELCLLLQPVVDHLFEIRLVALALREKLGQFDLVKRIVIRRWPLAVLFEVVECLQGLVDQLLPLLHELLWVCDGLVHIQSAHRLQAAACGAA